MTATRLCAWQLFLVLFFFSPARAQHVQTYACDSADGWTATDFAGGSPAGAELSAEGGDIVYRYRRDVLGAIAHLGPLGRFRALRIVLVSEHEATLAVALSDRDGATFNHPLPVPAGVRTEVVATPAGFVPNEDSPVKKSALDASRLDLGWVLLDGAVFAGEAGENVLRIEEVRIEYEPLPERAAVPFEPTSEWRKYAGNPVFTNHPFDPELGFAGDPGGTVKDGVFYLWYASILHWQIPDATPYGVCRFEEGDPTTSLPLGMAKSTDGIRWKRFDRGTPELADDYVLLRDSEDSWDSFSAETPTVVWDEGARFFRMWYTGTPLAKDHNDTLARQKIGYATSPDGIEWTKHDDPATTDALYGKSDPVLFPREGAWDDWFVGDPCVLHEGTTYRMWHAGTGHFGPAGVMTAIGYAESEDGVHWTRFDRPVLSPTEEDGWLAAGPEVAKIGDHYEMFYYTRRKGLWLATSADGRAWEKKGLGLPPGGPGDWDEFETSAPAILAGPDRFFLYYTGSRSPMEGEGRDPSARPHMRIGLAARRP